MAKQSYTQGQTDASQNKGAKQDHESSQAKEKYNAGYKHGKDHAKQSK